MIIYTVITRANDCAVLVEVSSPEVNAGNAPQITAMLLGHLRDHPELIQEGDRKTFVQRNPVGAVDFLADFLDTACAAAFGGGGGAEEQDSSLSSLEEEHYFHVYFKGGVFYCCIGDDSDLRDQKVNFAFLEQICVEFTNRHRAGRIANANAYALDKNFSPTVRSAVHYHNVNHKSIAQEERVQRLLAKVENMQKVMGRNIDLLLERGDNLEKLKRKSEQMEQDVAVFKKRSVVLRRRTQRKYYFTVIILSLIVFAIIYLSTIGICGAGFQYCKPSEKGGNNSGGSNNAGGNNNDAEGNNNAGGDGGR